MILETKYLDELPKPKGLLPFPPYFLINRLSKKHQQFLELKTEIMTDLECQFYMIPYFQYTKLKNENIGEKINHEQFETLKDYFTIKKLEFMKNHENVVIRIGSREEIKELKLPVSVNKINENEIIKKHGDAFIEFRSENLKEKFPFFFSELLFNNLKLFPDGLIHEKIVRKEIVSKLTNNKGIKKRNIVLREDKTQFIKIINLSNDNFNTLVESIDLLRTLELYHKDFEKYKNTEDYRKTL